MAGCHVGGVLFGLRRQFSSAGTVLCGRAATAARATVSARRVTSPYDDDGERSEFS
jgi:hypothetical protein